MSRVILFKGGLPEIIDSAHTPDYMGRPDAVINPDLSGVETVPMKYWKKSGNRVVIMTSTERDAVDTARSSQIESRASLNKKVDTALRTIGITLDEFRSAL